MKIELLGCMKYNVVFWLLDLYLIHGSNNKAFLPNKSQGTESQYQSGYFDIAVWYYLVMTCFVFLLTRPSHPSGRQGPRLSCWWIRGRQCYLPSGTQAMCDTGCKAHARDLDQSESTERTGRGIKHYSSWIMLIAESLLKSSELTQFHHFVPHFLRNYGLSYSNQGTKNNEEPNIDPCMPSPCPMSM